MAAPASTGSDKTEPHSSTSRFDVSSSADEVPAAVEQVEDLFRDFGLHRDDAPVVEDPEARGEDLLEEQIERVAGMSMSDLL